MLVENEGRLIISITNTPPMLRIFALDLEMAALSPIAILVFAIALVISIGSGLSLHHLCMFLDDL